MTTWLSIGQLGCNSWSQESVAIILLSFFGLFLLWNSISPILGLPDLPSESHIVFRDFNFFVFFCGLWYFSYLASKTLIWVSSLSFPWNHPFHFLVQIARVLVSGHLYWAFVVVVMSTLVTLWKPVLEVWYVPPLVATSLLGVLFPFFAWWQSLGNWHGFGRGRQSRQAARQSPVEAAGGTLCSPVSEPQRCSILCSLVQFLLSFPGAKRLGCAHVARVAFPAESHLDSLKERKPHFNYPISFHQGLSS